MNESGVWSTLKKGLAPFGFHMTRIESSAGNGVPDVSIGMQSTNAWMELKFIPAWPSRATTKVKLPLRPEQLLWIKTRGKLSGDVWVFVRIYDTFYLLNHREAAEAVNGWTHDEWAENAHMFWYRKIDFTDLASILKGGC